MPTDAPGSLAGPPTAPPDAALVPPDAVLSPTDLPPLAPDSGLSDFLVLFDKGGMVMWAILLLSIFALTITLAKFWRLWRFRQQLLQISQRVRSQIEEDNYPAALQICREYRTPLGQLFDTAIQYRDLSRHDLTLRLERLGGDVVAGLEAYMSALATVVGVAPMLGFLGTIIGLIESFRSWEALGDDVTVGVLAGGIYTAMLTTAAGLSVAIPYYLIYNHFTTRVKILTRLTEEHTEHLVDLVTLPEEEQEPIRRAL